MLQSHAKTLKREIDNRHFIVYTVYEVLFSVKGVTPYGNASRRRAGAHWMVYSAHCHPWIFFSKTERRRWHNRPRIYFGKRIITFNFIFELRKKEKRLSQPFFFFWSHRSGCGRFTVFSLHIISREKSGERHAAKNTVYYTEKQGCRQDTHKCAKMSVRAVPCIIIHLSTYTCQVHLYWYICLTHSFKYTI